MRSGSTRGCGDRGHGRALSCMVAAALPKMRMCLSANSTSVSVANDLLTSGRANVHASPASPDAILILSGNRELLLLLLTSSRGCHQIQTLGTMAFGTELGGGNIGTTAANARVPIDKTGSIGIAVTVSGHVPHPVPEGLLVAGQGHAVVEGDQAHPVLLRPPDVGRPVPVMRSGSCSLGESS